MSLFALGLLVGGSVSLLVLWIVAPLIGDPATLSPTTARTEELAAEVREALAEEPG